jgi:nucleoside-diphosphate-sugar epimerase
MDALKKKHQVLGIDKKFGVDVADLKRLFLVVNKLLGTPNLIIHLAAQTSRKKSVENAYQNFIDNVIGTFNICVIAKMFKAKLIFTSSRYAVPNTDGQQDPYGWSKSVDETMIQNFANNYALEFITNRIGNVYGIGQEGSQEAFWIAWFIEASLKNLPITIYGFKGQQSRDMLYIDDLVRLLVDEVENFDKYKNRLYEVGGGLENEISLIETLKLLNHNNYTFGDKLPGDSKRLVFDNKEISAVNGWKPKVGVKEGIDRVLKNIRKRFKNEN